MSMKSNKHRPRLQASAERLKQLAEPRRDPPGFMPDKISVYWLDYILDETPHKIVDPKELQGYYEKMYAKFPRVEQLAEPRVWTDFESDGRPRTANGISVAALKYKASRRIIELANPVLRDEYPPKSPMPLLARPPSAPDKFNWGDSDTSDVFSIGDFQSRSRYRPRTHHDGGDTGPFTPDQTNVKHTHAHSHDGRARNYNNVIMHPPPPAPRVNLPQNRMIQPNRRPAWR